MYQNLIEEIRVEKQVPPFFSDKNIEALIQEGIYFLNSLVENTDVNTDLRARNLLKTYVDYARHKQLSEFYERYEKEILSWQYSKIPSVTTL